MRLLQFLDFRVARAARGGRLTSMAATEKPCCESGSDLFDPPCQFRQREGDHSQRAGSWGPPCCACHCEGRRDLRAGAVSLPGSCRASASLEFFGFGAVSPLAATSPRSLLAAAARPDPGFQRTPGRRRTPPRHSSLALSGECRHSKPRHVDLRAALRAKVSHGAQILPEQQRLLRRFERAVI